MQSGRMGKRGCMPCGLGGRQSEILVKVTVGGGGEKGGRGRFERGVRER